MRLLLAAIFSTFATVVNATYWGEFLDEFVPIVHVDAERFWNEMTLTGDFRFRDPNTLIWTTPEGYTVNGASIPRWAWPIVGSPYTGRYLFASVIHDYYCETKERTSHDTHRNFDYGMRAMGVPYAKAKAMHWAVAVFNKPWSAKPPGSDLNFQAIQARTGAADLALTNALKQVEAVFEREQLKIESGGIESPQFDFEAVQRDADRFRNLLLGEVATESFAGYATMLGDRSIVSALESQNYEEVIFEAERGWPLADDFVNADGVYFDRLLPSGVPHEYEIRFRGATPDEIYDFVEKGEYGIVVENSAAPTVVLKSQSDATSVFATMVNQMSNFVLEGSSPNATANVWVDEPAVASGLVGLDEKVVSGIQSGRAAGMVTNVGDQELAIDRFGVVQFTPLDGVNNAFGVRSMMGISGFSLSE